MTSLLVRNCDGGHICHPPKECCRQGCCYPQEMPIYKTTTMPASNVFAPLFIGHWYFWAAITATLAGILCACSLWRRHSSNNSALFCCRDSSGRDERASEPDSNGSCYVPPQYSRCSSFHQAPPPYAEVTSKPDLYPLVISYNGDAVVKSNGSSTGYLMVQYFRNFIVRPVGSLSATSTIDSLSSSFICNASNEANTVIPPPYSCTGSLEEVNHHHQQNCTSSPTPPVAIATPAVTPPPPPPLPPSTMSRTHSNLCSRSSSANQLKTVPELGESAATTAPPKPQVPATPARFSRKLIFNKAKTHSADSESGGEEHNFSDLLNLSVCLPSGSITTQLAATQSNPQMTDMIQSYSVTNSMTSSDISSLANLGTPDSPPRATSPTIEMRELLDKIQQLPQHKSPVPEQQQQQHSQQQPQKKYFSRSKAKTLYMPLHHDPHQQHHHHHQQQSIKSGGGILKTTKGWLSRSAPNTPCGTFVPNFPRNPSSQRGSKSKICCDGSPLLTNDEHDDSDDERAHRDECL